MRWKISIVAILSPAQRRVVNKSRSNITSHDEAILRSGNADFVFVTSKPIKETCYRGFQDGELNTECLPSAEILTNVVATVLGDSFDVALKCPAIVDAKLGKGRGYDFSCIYVPAKECAFIKRLNEGVVIR